MKIVIQTQYCENYAWNEDGTLGTGPDAYWKFKGGSGYVVDCNLEQAQSKDFWQMLEDHVCYANDASKEYILSMELFDECDFKMEDHFQEWETPIMITPTSFGLIASKKYINDEFGYMRPEIKSKFESWSMLPGQERKGYSCSFTMEDGLILSSDELSTYLNKAA